MARFEEEVSDKLSKKLAIKKIAGGFGRQRDRNKTDEELVGDHGRAGGEESVVDLKEVVQGKNIDVKGGLPDTDVEGGLPDTDVEGGLPDTDVMARSFLAAIGRTGKNPGTKEEVIQNLIKTGHIKPTSFTDEDAETLVKAVYGGDVFERGDKQLKEIKLGDVPDLSNGEKPDEQKKDGKKGVVIDEKKSAIDKQIASMERELKKFEVSSKQFDKIATSEQKENREKKIEVLRRGIKDAKNRKAELKVTEVAESERAEKARAERDAAQAQAKISGRRKVLEDQIDQIKKGDKKFTDEDAETLVKAVYGGDVFIRDDKQLKEIELGDVPDLSNGENPDEQKKDEGKKGVVIDKKKSAIDKQIASMEGELKKKEVSSKQFDKIATSEQKENRAKEIEVLKRGIEDAENKKAELLEKEKARLELVEKAKAKLTGKKSTRATSDAERARRAAAKKLKIATPYSGVSADEEVKYFARHNKQADPKSKGVTPASGLLLEEEVRARLSANRKMASAKEDDERDKRGAAEVKGEVEQLDLPMDIPYGWPKQKPSEEQKADAKEKPPIAYIIVPEQSEKETPNEMEKLRKRVEDARKEYVEEDYNNTNRWLKIKNFFRHIKQEKGPDYEYYQAQYQNALIDLRNAELAQVRKLGLEGKEMNEALAGTLKYFKYDELVNVYNERTRVRVDHQGWPEKVVGMMEKVGRGYNSLSFKQKVFAAGTMWGLAGVTGGASLLAKRIIGGAGTAVALEATMEKISDRRQEKKFGKEAEQQIEILKQRAQNPEYSLKDNGFYMNEILDQDIFSLDEKLQKKKRDALFRKTIAFGAGFGAGYFYREIFHMLGVDELLREAKEMVGGFGGNETAEQIKEHLGEKVLIPSGVALPENAETAKMAAKAAANVKDSFIHDFVNQDIVVEKGDSVWKISGRLADQLNLDGTQRTHFIDALKDKFGDVQLQAGEHINFSGAGVNDDFVKNALEDSNALSPEQAAQILENNTRLSAFAEVNPNVGLTDKVTKNILEGKMPKVSDLQSFHHPASVADLHEGAQAHTTSQFRFGPQVDIEHQPIPEAISPEDIASEYGARADGWYDQIFKAENVQVGDRILGKDVVGSLKIRDVLHDANLFQQGAETGYTTGLSRQEIANFAKFDINASNGKSILFNRAGFLRNNPNVTLIDYLKKIASLTRRGQQIGLYTTL